MADIRLKDFASLTGYLNIADDDYLYLADHSASDGERKAVVSDLAAKVLGNRTIAGAAATDITTNNATQTMTNKTLTSPIINTPTIATPSISAATMTGTTVLPSTTSIGSVSDIEIGYLNGVTTHIQTQINGIVGAAGSISERVFCYGTTFVAAGSSADEITEATLMAGAGVPSGYCITPSSIHVSMATVSGGTFTRIDVATAALTWDQVTDGRGTHLVKVKPTLSAGTTYNIVTTFRIYADPA